MKTIGEILTTLRKEKGLTQDELANEIKISKSAIVRYENDKRKPDYSALIAYQEFFEVNFDYLLGKTHIRNYNDLIYPDQKDARKLLLEKVSDEKRQLFNKIFSNVDLLIARHQDMIDDEEVLESINKIIGLVVGIDMKLSANVLMFNKADIEVYNLHTNADLYKTTLNMNMRLSELCNNYEKMRNQNK